ncbi:MAG: alpha-L-fucosidase [Chitinophagaceae bacterium]
MKRLILPITIAALVLGSPLMAQVPGDEDAEMFNRAKQRDQQVMDSAVKTWWAASMKDHEARIAWWREAKFGMFIHWGVYSLPGGEWKGKKVSGYAEHLMRKEKITRADYLQLAHQFDPEKFNADQWAQYAKLAGMKYLIITAKHHDGFAMYDSKTSDFNIVQQTPFKRDPMAELAAACKKYGIRFGFYYSHAFDWEHPDAPGNDWEYNNPGGDKNLFGGARWYDVHPELLPKAQQYVTQKAIPQIKELLTKYHPDILWFDTPQKLPLSENVRILQAIRETDPNVVVNGRLVRSASGNFGDYKNTGDRPAEFFPTSGDWEAIPTTNESYGYHKYDDSHKPASFFIQLLAKAAAKGGNLLMNIGPEGDGTFDIKDVTILKGIGTWMDTYGESIYGTTASALPMQNWGVTTQKGNKIYLQVFNWPANGKLVAGGLKSSVARAYLLNDPKKKNLALQPVKGMDLVIQVPAKAPDNVNSVIVLEMKAPVVTDSVYYVAAGVPVTRLLAFDGVFHGKAFGFGDGKTNKYFAENWKSADQSISWKIRTAADGKYKVVAKYIADEHAGGKFQVKLDNNQLDGAVINTVKGSDITTQELGTVTLGQGVHIIEIKAINISGTELMKLLELQLIPSDK